MTFRDVRTPRFRPRRGQSRCSPGSPRTHSDRVTSSSRTTLGSPGQNALLRQQLIVAARANTRATFKPHERALIVFCASVVRPWRSAILLVQPETVLRWHRHGFRLFWGWKSRRNSRTEPRITPHSTAYAASAKSGADRIAFRRGLGVMRHRAKRFDRGHNCGYNCGAHGVADHFLGPRGCG